MDENETGGVLYGYERGQELVITRATGPGASSVRGKHRLTIDDRMSYGWKLGPQAPVEVGTWHVHGIGSSKPSRPDREAFRGGAERCRRETGLTSYCGLILADPPPGSDWLNPTIRANIVHGRRDRGAPHQGGL